MRIVQTRYKVVYFAICWAILTALNVVVVPVVPSGLVLALVQSIPLLVVVAGAARWFRGPDEDVNAPRPWWRATNRPTASFVLGAFYVVSLAIGIAEQFIPSASTTSHDALLRVPSAVACALLAFYFVNSGVRVNALHLPPRASKAPPTPTPAVSPNPGDEPEVRGSYISR